MPLIRTFTLNFFVEIAIRVALMALFVATIVSDTIIPPSYLESLPPFVRVIHPTDLESIYKYPRRESYVPGGALWALVLAVPLGTSAAAVVLFRDGDDAVEIVLAWSLALGINGVLTDTVKLIAGRPRPDFFYRCFPDGIATPDLQCTGDPREIMDGRKSFPSGHSSLAFTSLCLLSCWLCGRSRALSRRRGSAARVLLCITPLMLAACVALSRSCDYHHHPQDIAVGSILGYLTGLLCYRQYYNSLTSDLAGVPYIVSDNTKSSPVKSEKELESTPLLNGKKDDKWI